MSIIWRASISIDAAPKCKLGARYEEIFRRYLYGETGFPADAACALLFHDLPIPGAASLDSMCTMPVTTRNDGHHNHRFVIVGLQYMVAVGSRVPDSSRRVCIHHAADPKTVFLVAQQQLLDWPLSAMAEIGRKSLRSTPRKLTAALA